MEQAIEPRTVADAPPPCSICGKPAVSAYSWDWGETGYCCATHQAVLGSQTAPQIGRTISFTPIAPATPAPMTRDERARLKGEVYALEEEVKDLKLRGSDLYTENGKLAQRVQALTVRGRETEAQLRDAKAKIEELEAECERRNAEHGELVDEVTRLRTLEKFLPGGASSPAPA